MKYRVMLLVLFILCISQRIQAQTSQTAEQLSYHIAQKITDTLRLHDTIRVKLFNINMQIHSNKMIARKQYNNQPDSIGFHLQKIEKTRDSLYEMVIPSDLFLTYKQKKRMLVTSN